MPLDIDFVSNFLGSDHLKYLFIKGFLGNCNALRQLDLISLGVDLLL